MSERMAHAFAARSIAYAPPQGNWSERGHRLRDAEDVLQGRLASRLDAALVLASALEHLRGKALKGRVTLLFAGHDHVHSHARVLREAVLGVEEDLS